MENIDQKTIERVFSGEKEAFGELYEKYAEKIYRFIYYRVGETQTAQDILSGVFFKALKKINKFNPEKGNFSSWLYCLAKNSVIDYYRSRKNNIDLEEAFGIKSDYDMEKDINNKLRLEEVKKYLDRLKPEQKEMIIMRVWDELSYKEIAEIVGKSEAGCKMIFLRAIKVLKAEMPLSLLFIFLTNKII